VPVSAGGSRGPSSPQTPVGMTQRRELRYREVSREAIAIVWVQE
jgi:hypothetical protein